MVISRSSNGKTKVLLEHYRTLGTPTVNGVLDAGFKKKSTRGQGRPYIHQKGKTVVQNGTEKAQEGRRKEVCS